MPPEYFDKLSSAPIEGPHPAESLQRTGDRINTLLEASAAGGVVARERAEELVRLVADLYGAGLERVLTIVHDAGHLDDEVLDALAADHLVASLLLVHDLHPYDVTTRVERALEGVRPYLGSHGGDVELLEVTDEAVVRLRLLGSCDGCASSSVTLKLAVEGAIEAAAPEIVAIEVETPPESPLAAGAVIAVDSLWSRVGEPSDTGSAWTVVPGLIDLDDGQIARLHRGSDRAPGVPGREEPVRLPGPLRRLRGVVDRGQPGPAAGRIGRGRRAALPELWPALQRPSGRRLLRAVRAPPRPPAAARRSWRGLGRGADPGAGMRRRT